LGEVIQQLVECGHSYYDIIETYTLDQLWLFFEKAMIIKRKTEYELGMIFANCMALPLGGKEAVRGFEKFISSFLPEGHRKVKDRLREGKTYKQRNLKNQVTSTPAVDVEASFKSAFSFMELPMTPASK